VISLDANWAEQGGVQILANKAGVLPISPLPEDRVEEWEQTIDINIKRSLYITSEFVSPRFSQVLFAAYSLYRIRTQPA
jgi:NADP-dependent 3-hydroxy acid dehydrogenase YdfG